MDTLNIKQLRKAATNSIRPPQKFHSETLGLDVFMRELTSRESDDWGLSVMSFESKPDPDGGDEPKMQAVMDNEKAAGQRARLVCKCLCNEKGENLTDDQRQPLRESEVEAWPNRVVSELHGFATELNSLDEKAVADMGKGLGEIPGLDSTEDSQGISENP